MTARVGFPTPLIGRDEQLTAGRAVLDRLTSERGQALVLEGEAGVGKTRLLTELLDEAGRRGITVLRGSAHELEQSLPFGAIAEALELDPSSPDPDRAALGRLLSGQDAAGDGDLVRLRVVRAIVEMIDRVSRTAPVVLALEDLHWADPSTLLVLARLARRLELVPVGLMLTRRPYPEPPGLASVMEALDSAAVRRMALVPLPPEEVNDLICHLLGARPGPELSRHVAGAGGNPLFVTELVAALREEGTVRVTGNTADVTRREVPPSLRITILRRLSALPRPTVDLLRLAAVLGATFDGQDLAAFADRPARDVSLSLEPAVTARVLAAAGPRLAFCHDLIREAVYDDLPEAIRRGLHADAARVLESSGRPAYQVAPHLLRSAGPGDPRALLKLRRAAQEVRPVAHELAVELLRKALELVGPDSPAWSELLAELAEALIGSRRAHEAEPLARRLIAGRPGGRLEHRARLIVADALVHSYRTGDAIGHLEQAFADPLAGPTEKAELSMRLAILWQLKCDLDRSEHWAQQARDLGTTSGEASAVTVGLLLLASSRRYRGLVHEAEALAELAEASVSSELQHLYTDVGFFRAAGWALTDHPEQGLPVVRAALRQDEQRGRPLTVHHNLLGTIHSITGEWDDAVAEWEVLARPQDETATGGRALAASVLSYIALHRDDPTAAEAWARLAEEASTQDDMQPLSAAVARHARGLLADVSGDARGAVELLASASRSLHELDYRLFAPLVPVDAARVARIHDAEDLAREAATHAAVLAERCPFAHARAAALQCQGLAANDADVLDDAVAAWRETSWVPATAAACVDAARALADVGRSSEAVARAEEALTLWERVGATREVARTIGTLRDLGVRRGRRGARRRPATGWDSLTDTERRVVALVADGLTYREVADRLFVSRRTVETHVAHAFGKVGVSSRRDLERAWLAR